MPEYGSRLYWEKRYSKSDEAFDWMCDYDQLSPTLIPLIHNKKNGRILIVGCGNANFSSDFCHQSKCKKVIHIDYCEVVIQQQKKKFPDLDFRVMDALDMDFCDDEFDVIIDKSLIDTTLCYHDGHNTTMKLFKEMHRVLKPGGRIVTISLHTEDEVEYFKSSDDLDFDFMCSTCKIVNLRRQQDEYDIRCLYHTMAVFDKVKNLTLEEKAKIEKWHENPVFKNELTNDEYDAMVDEILVAQEALDDEYYKSLLVQKEDEQHQYFDTKVLLSILNETKLDNDVDHSNTCYEG